MAKSQASRVFTLIFLAVAALSFSASAYPAFPFQNWNQDDISGYIAEILPAPFDSENIISAECSFTNTSWAACTNVRNGLSEIPGYAEFVRDNWDSNNTYDFYMNITDANHLSGYVNGTIYVNWSPEGFLTASMKIENAPDEYPFTMLNTSKVYAYLEEIVSDDFNANQIIAANCTFNNSLNPSEWAPCSDALTDFDNIPGFSSLPNWTLGNNSYTFYMNLMDDEGEFANITAMIETGFDSADNEPLPTGTVKATIESLYPSTGHQMYLVSADFSVDTKAPTLSSKSNIITNATNESGAVVTFFVPTATDLSGIFEGATCLPASGAVFSNGATNVVCSAQDRFGNTGYSNFTVIVNALPLVGSISPANDTKKLASSVTFSATPSDDESTTLTCALYVNGLLNSTNTSAINNTATLFTASFAAGTYYWNIGCADENGSVILSSNRSLTVDTSADDLAFSSIAGENSAESSITSSLNLITIGSSDFAAISWSSNNSAVIRATDGKVTRPAYGTTAATVNLTAAISRQGFASAQKSFILNVTAETSSATVAVNNTINALNITLIINSNADDQHITGDLNLPTVGVDGTAISWSSDNTAIISSQGTVIRSSTDKQVNLIANATKGNVSQTKNFWMVVLGTADANLLAVESSKSGLTDALVLNGNPTLDFVIGNLEFPTSNSTNGVNISWTTTNAAVINTSGYVTRSATSNTLVNATANLSKGSAYSTKFFQFTVAKIVAPATFENSTVTVANGTKEILLDTSNAENVTKITIGLDVAADQPVAINIASLVSASNVTLAQGGLNLSRQTSSANYSAEIPNNTVITGASNWNGMINLPTVKLLTDISVPSTSTATNTVESVIEVGFTGGQLNFSKAVKLTIPGKTGLKVVYKRNDGTVVYSNECTSAQVSNPDSLADAADCYTNSGSDLVIWTKHFTEFAAYKSTAISSSTNTGSGSSSISAIATTPTPVPAATATPIPAGCRYNNPACSSGYECDINANTCYPEAKPIVQPTAIPTAKPTATAAVATVVPTIRPTAAPTPGAGTGLFVGSLIDKNGNLTLGTVLGIVVALLAAVGFVWHKAGNKYY